MPTVGPSTVTRAAGSRQCEQILERVVEEGRPGDQQHIGRGHDFRRQIGRAVERHLLGFERGRVLLQHQIGLAAALQLLQKRDEGADQDDALAFAYVARVERVGARQQRDPGIGAAAPAQFGERIQGGDADRAGEAVFGERALHQFGRRAPGKRLEPRRPSRDRAAYVAGDRIARRRAGSGSLFAIWPGGQLDPGEEEPDDRALDRNPLEFPAENVGDAGDRLVQNGAVHGPPSILPVPVSCSATDVAQ